MPSIEAPTHYERSVGIAHSKFDEFFRYLNPDFYSADTGDIESPFGWVGLLKVDEAAYASIQEYKWPIDLPEQGWYVVRHNDQGLVWGIEYGPLDSTFNEERARADFAEAETAYEQWQRLEERFDEDMCNCGMPGGWHTSDCSGHQ